MTTTSLTESIDGGRVLVYGLAKAATPTVAALVQRGFDVVVADDTIDDARRSLADELGVPLMAAPTDAAAYVADFALLVPSPGVPESHPVVVAALAAGIPVWSEIELAYRFEQQRPGGPRPILAITGTDGKTTTTDLTVALVRAAGLRAESLGNTDIPMIQGIDLDLEVLVVECTSFRLAWTEEFRADAAVWLNLAPDHLNWHVSLDTYIAAKDRLFSLQRPTDAAIGFRDDPVVMGALADAPGRHRTFGRADADYFLDGDVLRGPAGAIATTASMWRALPHDITNALAASALVLESGVVEIDQIAAGLAGFAPPPHRLQFIGERDQVSWYNDSKATTPHAAATAIRAFESLVLIAGGSRKGVDLSPIAAEPKRVRTVVAIGEAASDVRAAFTGSDASVPVVDAESMAEAVRLAASTAAPGDAVVLSPGCASFDWYRDYTARGDDFVALVTAYLAGDVAGEATDQSDQPGSAAAPQSLISTTGRTER